jgi:hypothetical protein
VNGDGEIVPGIALSEALRRKIEGRALLFQLPEQATDQNAEWNGHQLNQCSTS